MFGNGSGNGWGGLGPNPTDLNKEFKLQQVEIAVFDRLAHELLMDFIVIQDIVKELPEDSNRANQVILFKSGCLFSRHCLSRIQS